MSNFLFNSDYGVSCTSRLASIVGSVFNLCSSHDDFENISNFFLIGLEQLVEQWPEAAGGDRISLNNLRSLPDVFIHNFLVRSRCDQPCTPSLFVNVRLRPINFKNLNCIAPFLRFVILLSIN